MTQANSNKTNIGFSFFSKRSQNDIDLAIAEVTSVLDVTFADSHQDFALPTTREIEDVLRLLEYDVENAVVHFTDVRQAEKGLLMDFNPVVELQGATNAGTTCYIDTLLFAMFARQRAFDGLLLRPVQNSRYRGLQSACRLFVNQLRRGSLVRMPTVLHLQRRLRESGWGDPTGNYRQEDVTELFLFLASAFEMPFLPMHNSLLHGGLKDENDEKVVTERALQLSIPDNTSDALKGPILLEDLLAEHFHGTIVEGIVRSVATDLSVDGLHLDPPASPPIPRGPTYKHLTQINERKQSTTTSDEVNLHETFSSNHGESLLDEGKHITARPVNAWSVLDLLPFYSSANELGEILRDASTSQFDDRGIILPMVLKRYKIDPKTGATKRNNRSVLIPVEICFNKFVTSATASSTLPSVSSTSDRSFATATTNGTRKNSLNNSYPYQLRLRSAVCHLGGSSPSSGHYIAYAADIPDATHARADLSGTTGRWHCLDDLAVFPSQRVVCLEGLRNTTLSFKDMSENAYLLMYELVRGRPPGDDGIDFPGLPRTTLSVAAEHRPRNTSEDDTENDLSHQCNREKECALERSSSTKLNDDFITGGLDLHIRGTGNGPPCTPPSPSDCDGEIARQLQAQEFDFGPHEDGRSNFCRPM